MGFLEDPLLIYQSVNQERWNYIVTYSNLYFIKKHNITHIPALSIHKIYTKNS
jgi:hypothetical protein